MEPTVRNSITERVVFTGVWIPDQPREREAADPRGRPEGPEPAVRGTGAAARSARAQPVSNAFRPTRSSGD